jgi:hypothetical protein
VITFANNIDFANHPQITMKVWTSAPVGTYVTLKAEKPFWGEERSVQTTKTEQWELLTFDFTNAPTDMPSLAFLFDFTAGSTNVGDGTATSTFYFDEIKFANVPLGEEELGELNSIKIYPNPTNDYWTFTSVEWKMLDIKITSIDGRLVDMIKVDDASNIAIDSRNYAPGTYIARVSTTKGLKVVKLVKR